MRRGLGGDQVGETLRRGEIELAVQEGAAGELAGLGEPEAELPQRGKERGDDGAAAMDMEFRHILARDAARRREIEREAAIDGLAGRVAEAHEPRLARRRHNASKRGERRRRLSAGKPQHRDAGTTGRGRERIDRVAAASCVRL